MSESELRMNLTALRRVDPYALDIVDSATHVALYTFDENEWEKTSIEGALFVYRRSGEPRHSMLVMNRLNTDNLIEPVSRGLELQLQEPFLLYRNSRGRIYGIWFYDKDECVRLARKLTGLVQRADEPEPPALAQRRAAPVPRAAAAAPTAPAAVDIFSMLSKAQDDYNSNKSGEAAPVAVGSAPRAPDLTSQSVMDFFAKAGGGSQLPAPPAAPALFGSSRTAPPDVRDAPLLLQRLMSNPAHSVEHIEKQQRSVTPQEPLCSTDRRNGAFDKSRDTVGRQPSGQQRSKNKKAHPHNVGDTNGQLLENDLKFMCISSPKSSSPLATFLAGGGADGPGAFDTSAPLSSTLNACSETPQKPALMPPTMFTSTAAVGAEAPPRPAPEPLTRNQLLQAFNYLIKHDADFVNKLHEAYVKSFSELVS